MSVRDVTTTNRDAELLSKGRRRHRGDLNYRERRSLRRGEDVPEGLKVNLKLLHAPCPPISETRGHCTGTLAPNRPTSHNTVGKIATMLGTALDQFSVIPKGEATYTRV
jgi:hypothetical protein